MNKVDGRQRILNMEGALEEYFEHLDTTGFMVPERRARNIETLEAVFKKVFNGDEK